ncbi:MAG: LysR family transcriptional regulator [Planococcus sp. (in: firmicutes)]|nr:LysR family transcriptional regulator [Planococcus sp. (in: firmicutes)]
MLGKLHTFQVLAECRSYTEAAKQLYCSQPSVSQQIRYLEEYYGVKLIIRKKQGVELTERGVLLQKQAGQLLELFEATRHLMATPGTQKPVAIYMSKHIAESYYEELFDSSASCCKACPFEINGRCYMELREQLLAKRAKFAVMPIYPGDDGLHQAYDIQGLFEEEFQLVFSASHPLATRKVIYAKDLEHASVLQTQSRHMQALVQQALEAKGVEAFYMQMTDFKIIKKALRQSDSVSFLPLKALDSTDASLVYRSVKGLRIVRQNGLVIDPEQQLTQAEQAYCDHIMEKLSSF